MGNTQGRGGFMRIAQMVQMQEAMKQHSKGDVSIVRQLLGEEDVKPKKIQREDTYIPMSSRPPEPNWDRVHSKRAPIMSEEEFEQAIIAMARANAEFAMKKGDTSWHLARDQVAYLELHTAFVSVVSPDRRAAFANSGGNNVIHGTVPNHLGGNELMDWSPSGWTTYPTVAEMERGARFNEIYNKAYQEWEAENGTIPHGTKKGLRSFTSTRNWL